MSFTTWTPDALRSSARRAAGRCWRFVEAQHRVSTLKLTDTLEEQERLEALLEKTKPPIPAECRHLDARAVDLARQGIVEGPRQNARRRRFADPAHARQDIGVVDAARGEGIGKRAHHRLLADEVLEPHRPVFSRQHPIGGCRRRGRSFGSREERIAQRRPLLAGKGRWRSILSFASLDEPPLGGEGGLKLTLA